MTTGAGGRCRGAFGGVIARQVDGLGTPPGPTPKSTAGCAMPAAPAVRRRVRVEMRPEGGKTFRGVCLTGLGLGLDAVGSVITAECSPFKVLVGGGER